MALDDATWAEIGRLYRDSDLTVAEIVDRYGISNQMLYSRRDREGWPKRSSRAGRSRSCAGAVSTTESSELLLRRLYRAIDVKLQRLERRMASGDEPTIADSERETRELAQMIRSFEKVTEVAADIAKPADKRAAARGKRAAEPAAERPAPVYVSADAERMRREIAERLERLHRAREPGA